ncbi:TolC family protein [Geobacter pickeringii]|uniref:TolC family protein n=1 Tax=Geobacter pickeringii TaxID=345632 RepID=UPI0009FF4CCE|nr:TolC family protein [Geobacter pickeringii]
MKHHAGAPAIQFSARGALVLGQALLAFGLLAASSARGEGVPTTLDLSRKAAIEMAIRKNIDLKTEALNSSMAVIDVSRSRGIYDPLFGISANGGVVSTPGDPFFRTKSGVASISLSQLLPTGGSISAATQSGFTNAEASTLTTTTTEWQSSVGLSATQPLLRNAGKEATELSITLAENSQQDSVERLRFFISDTVLSVITSYNRLFTLRKTLESRLTALNSAQGLRDEIQTRMKGGKKQDLEIANAEYAIAQRRKDLVEAERNVRDQEATLRYLIGIEDKTQIVTVDPPSREEPPETEDQVLKKALELRNDLKQLQLSLKSSQLQERVARHQALPDLSLSASGGFTGTADNFGRSYRQIGERPGSYWSAGMVFSVPLGNTALRNDYLKSKIRTEQLGNQIKALAWKIRNDVESDLRALISARLQMQTADRALQYAEQRREEYRKQGRAGTTTVQDVINADNDLTAARTAQMEALETFAYTVSKLWRDAGELLERQGIQIDAAQPEKIVGDDGGEGSPPKGDGKQSEETTSPSVALQRVAFHTDRDALAVSDGGNALFTGPVKTASEQPGDVLPHRQGDSQPAAGSAGSAKGVTVPGADAKVPQDAPSPTVEGSDPSGREKRYTLRIGEYVARSALEESRSKVAEAGLSSTVEQGSKKTVQMLRLYLDEYPNREAARMAVEKLRALDADPFIIRSGEHRHRVYAGSYSDRESALREQARLSGKGMKLRMVAASVTMPTLVLVAGNFSTEEAARIAVARLEERGIRASVAESGL